MTTHIIEKDGVVENKAAVNGAKSQVTAQRDEDFLTPNALVILRKRYLRRNRAGEAIETAVDMFHRVAQNIAEGDRHFGADDAAVAETEATFYKLMTSLAFVPNSPTLRGAGRRLQQLAACFVLPIGDSLEEIFDALKAAAIIHKTGGGVGYSFSQLRPKGDQVFSTGNVAGGPLSFMKVFNSTAQEITQGGVRMGANMGILNVHHPDILEFATIKLNSQELTNFNISGAATDAFMQAVEDDEMYDLINPRSNKVVERIQARDIFDKFVENAWRCGDPGLIFIDQINRDNPTPHIGAIESTNPCGEQPLLPYESCTLGSINLTKMVVDGQFDWDALRETVHTAVHFLDNVITMNRYPIPEIEESTKGTRKIGLGVMGFADTLIQLGIQYDSEAGIEMGDRIMGFISQEAQYKSVELAKARGVFPYFKGSTYDREGGLRVRNACQTTIAPTGTISVIAGVSSGIEPLFAIVYKRNTLFNKDGATETLYVVNPNFEQIAKERGFYSEELIEKIAETGSVQHIEGVPDDVKAIFRTSHDIMPKWHVRMQAAFQKHIDSAVSKTINFPHQATVDDVREAYMLAWKLGCKGITVYRDGSREFQVLDVGKDKGTKKETAAPAAAAHTNGHKAQTSMIGMGPVRPRPTILNGYTHRITTPLGNTYVTINENEKDQPFEVFLQASKAGSNTAAVSEAIGRLISQILRLTSPVSPRERLKEVVRQLQGIGGSRPHGFGANRVLSFPDGIAQVLEEYLHPGKANGQSLNGSKVASPDDAYQSILIGDLCPDCGEATLINEEGCRKCHACGFSEC